jgi:hypothetical protein
VLSILRFTASDYPGMFYKECSIESCCENSSLECDIFRYIESNTGKSARQGNLRYTRVRFQSFADEARDFPVLHFLPVFDLIDYPGMFYKECSIESCCENSSLDCDIFPSASGADMATFNKGSTFRFPDTRHVQGHY